MTVFKGFSIDKIDQENPGVKETILDQCWDNLKSTNTLGEKQDLMVFIRAAAVSQLSLYITQVFQAFMFVKNYTCVKDYLTLAKRSSFSFSSSSFLLFFSFSISSRKQS